MSKRVWSLLMLFVILTSFISFCYASDTAAPNIELLFPDLKYEVKDKMGRVTFKYYYAIREVHQATRIGFIQGYDDGTFKPFDSIKRSEFVKMLIVLATNRNFDFSSVESEYNTWWGGYIAVAEMQGIVNRGQFTLEEWEEPITRLEAVMMLSKTQIKMKGIPQNQIGKLVYKDIDSLTDDEKALLLHAVKYDLLEGMKDGSIELFEPNKNFTRGEAAAALMRIY